MKIGDRAFYKKRFTETEVRDFGKLSNDDNPIHYDVEYASASRFKKRIVQGSMVGALIGGVLGSRLPGPGTIYINQETNFLKPVFIDEEVTAWVEVIKIREDKPVITLRTWVENTEEKIVLEGKAVVLYLAEKL